MSELQPVERLAQEEQVIDEGIISRIKGSRIAQYLHRLNSGKYEAEVPAVYRRIAEEHGLPKPTQYIRSAQGEPIEIPDAEILIRRA